jgi:hypothetical protein
MKATERSLPYVLAVRAGLGAVAEAALADIPPAMLGPGSVHRRLAKVWRARFSPTLRRQNGTGEKGRPHKDDDE